MKRPEFTIFQHHYILDENKNPIPASVDEWSDQYEEMAKNQTRHIAFNIVNDKRISTVWIGLNHEYRIDFPPLIFETIVFYQGRNDIYCDRYSTWKEAEEGHKKAVKWVLDGCLEDLSSEKISIHK